MTANSVTASGRRLAEALMTSTCVIVRAGSVSTDANGVDTPSTTTIYSGPCRLRMQLNRTTGAQAAGQSVEKQQPELWVPLSDATTANIRPDDTATVTLPLDPEVITTRIAGLHAQTHSTARRLHVEIQS